MATLVANKEKAEQLIKDALSVAKQAGDKAASSDIGRKVADAFNKYSTTIQEKVDEILAKRGLVTQEQLDSLDEEVRKAKMKLLEEKSKNTLMKYGVFLGVVVLTFAGLWLITKKNTNE